MASPERCIDMNPHTQGGADHGKLIEDFLNQTYQKENEPTYRCGGVPIVDLYDSEQGNAANDAGNTENFDPKTVEAQGNAQKAPGEIATEYANKWINGDFEFMKPFFDDLDSAVNNSTDKVATLQTIEDGMNGIFKTHPEVRQVKLEMKPDGRIDFRYGTNSEFLQRFIDLKTHKVSKD